MLTLRTPHIGEFVEEEAAELFVVASSAIILCVLVPVRSRRPIQRKTWAGGACATTLVRAHRADFVVCEFRAFLHHSSVRWDALLHRLPLVVRRARAHRPAACDRAARIVAVASCRTDRAVFHPAVETGGGAWTSARAHFNPSHLAGSRRVDGLLATGPPSAMGDTDAGGGAKAR